MTALVWGSVGQRYFESGVDRGVLYPKVGPGVAWSGLKSISENPNGGSPTPFYADGYKYLNLASAEEFAVTLEAFSAPQEFAACDGTQSVLNGLFITQQRRQPFGLAYRTRIGNDVDGTEHGYKLHLIYNALASASGRNYQSIGASSEPSALSWQITTTPPEVTGYRPSAHFIIDSRYTPKVLMNQFEGMLYGTGSTDAYLPTISQMMAHFNSLVVIQLLKEGIAGAVNMESTPAIRSAVAPTPAPGQSVLWLDISAGYSKLTLVTGE
jgi:hypothetical protein